MSNHQHDEDRGLRCAACGSDRVIPDVRIVDQGKHSDGDLQVVVYGNPDALIFKERAFSKLLAQVCGECGYVWLRVRRPDALYEAYQDAIGRAGPTPEIKHADWPPDPLAEP